MNHKNIKVKELVVDPGKSMGFQRHFERNEIWLISEGSYNVSYSNDSGSSNIKDLQLTKFDHYFVPIGHRHQISNPSKTKTHIIEIQYGEDCIESDIERIDKV